MSDPTFRSIIADHKSDLEELIEVKYGLLSRLVQHKVITRRHEDAIRVNFDIVSKHYKLI